MGSSPATAVIAAAGSGERLGAGGPKAFVALGGRPMVEWSIEALRGAERIGPIVVACPPGRLEELSGPELEVVPGGDTRARSVANALEAVGTELVAIHDAARPLVTAGLVDEVVGALVADPGAAGAIAAVPVTDTIKRAHELAVEETVDRGRLWAAQTPQVFRTEALREALEAGSEDAARATDEAMLVERAGGRVLIHPSTPENLKVTTPLDLRLAELLLAERGA